MKNFRALKRNLLMLSMLSLFLVLATGPASASQTKRIILKIVRVPIRLVQISSALFFLGSSVAVTSIDYYCASDLAKEANDKFEAEAQKKQKALDAVPESEVDHAS